MKELKRSEDKTTFTSWLPLVIAIIILIFLFSLISFNLKS